MSFWYLEARVGVGVPCPKDVGSINSLYWGCAYLIKRIHHHFFQKTGYQPVFFFEKSTENWRKITTKKLDLWIFPIENGWNSSPPPPANKNRDPFPTCQPVGFKEHTSCGCHVNVMTGRVPSFFFEMNTLPETNIAPKKGGFQ